MVFFNYSTMQMAAKVVYYGPGLCGKTTNLQWIFEHTSTDSRGEMVSLATETDRTLFFDLLPIDVGSIAGFSTRIQLYTVPGQVFYNTTRKLVLKGVDGVVFVADSQKPMLQANTESFQNLEENLARQHSGGFAVQQTRSAFDLFTGRAGRSPQSSRLAEYRSLGPQWRRRVRNTQDDFESDSPRAEEATYQESSGERP